MENFFEHFYKHWSLDYGVTILFNIETNENFLVNHIIDQLVSKLHYQIVQKNISNSHYYTNRWHYRLLNHKLDANSLNEQRNYGEQQAINKKLYTSKSSRILNSSLRFEENYIKGHHSLNVNKAPKEDFKLNQKAIAIHKSIAPPKLFVANSDLLNFTNNYLIANSNYLAYQLDKTDLSYKDFDSVYLQIKSLDLIKNSQQKQQDIFRENSNNSFVKEACNKWNELEQRIINLLNSNSNLLEDVFRTYLTPNLYLDTNKVSLGSGTSQHQSSTQVNQTTKKFIFSNGSLHSNDDYLKDLNKLNLITSKIQTGEEVFDLNDLDSEDFTIAFNAACKYLQCKFPEISKSFYLSSTVPSSDLIYKEQSSSDLTDNEIFNIKHNFWWWVLLNFKKIQTELEIDEIELSKLKILEQRYLHQISESSIFYQDNGIFSISDNFSDNFKFWGRDFFVILRKYLISTIKELRGTLLLEQTVQIAFIYNQVVNSLFTQINESIFLISQQSHKLKYHQILKINLFNLVKYLGLKGSEIIDEFKLTGVNCYLIKASNHTVQSNSPVIKNNQLQNNLSLIEQFKFLSKTTYLDSKFIHRFTTSKFNIQDLFTCKLDVSCTFIYQGIIFNHSYIKKQSTQLIWKFTYFPLAHNLSLG